MALRTPAARIGNDLLNGITTITPSVRYLTFISWITFQYWKRGGVDSLDGYLEYAGRVEAAIVLGNLVIARKTTGLVGSDSAPAELTPGSNVELKLAVQQLATGIYSNAAGQLRLFERGTDATVPHLTHDRGMVLARVFDEAIRDTALGKRLTESDLPDTASFEELTEFGERVRIRAIPPQEREILLGAILPDTPTSPAEQRRLATYGIFLYCFSQGKTLGYSQRFWTEVTRADRQFPPAMAFAIDGWMRYLVRDMLAVVHEYALNTLVNALPHGETRETQFLTVSEAVSTALQNNRTISQALRDLRLLSDDESWETLSITDLSRRVKELTSEEELRENGLRRWVGGLHESDVIRVSQQYPDAAPALLPVAWLLSERRAEPGSGNRTDPLRDLSHEGTVRIGLSDVIVPRLEKFRQTDVTWAQAAGELLVLTVEQHLRTAWGRLASEGKEVSVILSDGNRWAWRKWFGAGRTASRHAQVESWLRQLGLLDDTGLTPAGETYREQIWTNPMRGDDQ